MSSHAPQSTESIPPVLKLPQVRNMTGLSTASIYRLASQGLFPLPIKLSIRATGWKLHELENWLADRPRACIRPFNQ